MIKKMAFTKKVSFQKRRRCSGRRVASRRRRRTQKRKTTGGRRGDSREFSVMTFNVELFLNLYDFAFDDDDGKRVVSARENIPKMRLFNQLFATTDVACLQETYMSTEAGYPLFPNPLERVNNFSEPSSTRQDGDGMRVFSVCRSEPLAWPRSKYLYGTDSHLANAVCVRNGIKVTHSTRDLVRTVNEDAVQRCFASATIQLHGTPITIASVHLTGGRFDDKEAILNPEYTLQKLHQIQDVVEKDNPDIICGDFNTKIKTPQAFASTQAYFHSLLPSSADEVSAEEQADRQQRWDTWIYMDTIHQYLTERGYLSVYYRSDGSLIDHIQDTSAYGGIVDMIYYKDDSLELVPDSVQVVGEGVVMTPIPDKEHTYVPKLSDHSPVQATFRLRTHRK